MVIIKREKSYIGMVVGINVLVNNSNITSLRNGEKYQLNLEAGTYSIQFQGAGANSILKSSKLNVNIKSEDDVVIIECKFGMSSISARVVSVQHAKKTELEQPLEQTVIEGLLTEHENDRDIMMNSTRKKLIIISSVLLLWGSIGLYLTISSILSNLRNRQLYQHYANYRISSSLFSFVSIFFVYVPFIVGIVLLGLAIHKKLKETENKKLTKLSIKYLSMLGNNQSITIERLAAIAQKDYVTIINDLETIISAGLLSKAYIDYARKELVADGTASQNQSNPVVSPQASAETIFKCNNCGAANNIVPGKTKICEFCGIAINIQ